MICRGLSDRRVAEVATLLAGASIQGAMALCAESVHKPFRKIEKLLKDFPDPPSPEDVHDLRTHTRRIEAVVVAFQLDCMREGRELVKSLKPIRKAAGEVRDMDVLTDFVASLDPRGDGDCRVELIEHLANQRTTAARKLLKKVKANAKEARSELKQCRKIAEKGLSSATSRDAKDSDKRKRRRKSVSSMGSSFQLQKELSEWPKLNDGNMHPFRLKVKELRYVLQLGEKGNSELIDALGEVKDQIGLWHDWNELSGIAADVLDHGAACPIEAQIRARTKQELQDALDGANRLRSKYLTSGSSASRKKGAAREIHPAMVKAASRLAS